jgi:hyperosmotically inducible periplasmic protein
MKTLRNPLTLTLAALLAVVLSTAGCATTQSPGEQVGDAELSSRVKAKLAADPDVNPFNIDVDARNGMVTLKGSVDDAATRTEAGRLARDTSGVVSVDNGITVGGESAGDVVDDAAIVTKIKTKLAADLEVAATNIDVDSEQGVVTLTGEVRSSEARNEAEKLARDTSGVVRVVNNITVGG